MKSKIPISISLLIYFLILFAGFKILIAVSPHYTENAYKWTLIIFAVMLFLPLPMFANRGGKCKKSQAPSRGLGGTMGDSSVLFICLALFFFSPICFILMLIPITVVGMFMPLVTIINTLGG